MSGHLAESERTRMEVCQRVGFESADVSHAKHPDTVLLVALHAADNTPCRHCWNGRLYPRLLFALILPNWLLGA